MAKTRPRVYIDSCYFIDAVKGRLSLTLDEGRERHLPYIESLLLAAFDGEIEIWASSFVIAECLHVESTRAPQNLVPNDVRNAFVRMLESGNPVRIQSADVFVAEKARDLAWTYEIKCGGGADAIHVATALELNCTEFISTNRKRGPLNADASKKLLNHFGLAVIEAPQTQVLPIKYVPSPLFGSLPS